MQLRRTVPASFFGIILGIVGLGNGWRVATTLWSAPSWISESIMLIGAIIWLILTVLFIGKWLLAREQALNEARHPVQCCFIGLVFASTLLIAIAAIPYSRSIALALATFGWIGNILFATWRTGGLWQGQREANATTAVLYLPTVASNFIGAIAAGALGLHEFAMLQFGVGLFSWLAIESILINRLYTAEPLPLPLRPTLGIQLAPPVVGCLAYLAVNGGVPDLFAYMLIGYGLLQALVMVRLIPWFLEQKQFVPGYWAFSFGVTALPLALLRMLAHGGAQPVAALALPLFIVANVFIAGLTIGTLKLLFANKLLPSAPALKQS